ncbi:MAG: ADOP family duplicated permease [Acidobacteriota bacterium]
MLFDLRLAFASLRREGLLSLLVIAILGASLGVHTAVFSLVNATFYRPLPYADADQLVVVRSVSSKTGGVYGLSLPDADDFAVTAEHLDEIGAFSARRDNLIDLDDRVTSIPSALVTSGVLPATGVTPHLGRLFDQDDDFQGADSFKVIISHGLWRSRYGADPNVLGQTLRTSLGTFQIVGVLPVGYGFPEGAQLWFPYQSWIDTQDTGDTREDSRALRWPQGLARLTEPDGLERARAEIDNLAGGLAERHPETNADWRPRLEPYRAFATSGLAPHLRSLFTLTWVFVALAAINLTGLQLARGVARTATFSLQLALGARGSRLGRQLLFETLLLTIPGALLGLGLAKTILAFLPRLIPTSLPPWIDIRLGLAEIGFATSAALLVALIAGLAPLILGWRLDLRTLLAGRAAPANSGRFRRLLIVAEVALAAVLLVAAGLLARSFDSLQQITPGFATDNVVTVQMSPQFTGTYVEQADGLAAMYRRVQTRLLDVPGIDAVGGTTHLPYLDRDRRPVTVVVRGGADEETLEHQAPFLTVDITPGYFASMNIPIVEGRDFRWSDHRDDGLVIILSRRAVEQLFPGQSALGKEVRLASDSWARVIGVVGDVRYDPRETTFGAELYYPITQYKAWRQRLTVHLQGTPEALMPSLRQALDDAAPEAGVVEIRPLGSILDESLWQSRLLGRLAPLFALVAMLLASLGVYGLAAHDLAQRRHELGVRAALGAPREALGRLVLWWGARLVIMGVVSGIAISFFAAAPLLAASLFGIEAQDPATLIFAAVALITTGLVACLVPAWRAMNVHPTESLRES